ncbi:hypothetical protein ACMYUM_28635 (plasmid) [Priestia megaterium]|uniref:hypothetical protein n=1 Tax=Priestia TaxID=2800373 RepID=UPI0021D65068|nr:MULTISPECIES: hypothetical protein [Priestia]MDN4634414.1 hypothetical protein [Sphingomonas sp. PsM26]MCU7713111.1 hypothetical protein [Priestia megaterium]MDH3135356.1 hypothetical protein [Priestia aryabhattai]MDH3135364.1 hypothetical protein [Priestia aryabhattai]MED3821001.1 hypothetical protein [Priestia aryabhattai]
MRIKFEEPVTPELIASTLQELMEEYEVTLSKANLYINFRNADGELVTLVNSNGDEVERVIVKKPKTQKPKKKKSKSNLVEFPNKEREIDME